MDLYREVFIAARRLRNCAPVDNEFPELMERLDLAIGRAESAEKAETDEARHMAEVAEDNAQYDATMSIAGLAREHSAWVAKMGWHNKTTLEALALIASEVGEAVNECRGDKPTAKLGEELADIILRTLDLSVTEGIDIEQEIIEKMLINKVRGTRGRRI